MYHKKIIYESNFPATVHGIVNMRIISKKHRTAGDALMLNHGYVLNHKYTSIESTDENKRGAKNSQDRTS